jgi:hypothetical protein
MQTFGKRVVDCIMDNACGALIPNAKSVTKYLVGGRGKCDGCMRANDGKGGGGEQSR